MAEELRFRELARQRGAVDLDEHARRALRTGVHFAGDDVFADARLAGDEHGHIGVGDALDELVDAAHGRARAELRARLDRRLGRDLRARPVADDALQDFAQLLDVERLRDVVGGAGAHGPDDGVGFVERRAHDDGRLAAAGAITAQGLDAVELGHDDVEDDDVGRRRARQALQGGLAAGGALHGEAERVEQHPEVLAARLVIVDHQHR